MGRRRILAVVLMAGALGVLAAGCGDSDSDGDGTAGRSSTSSSAAPSSTTTRPPAASCDAAALLPPVQTALDRPANPAGGPPELRVVSVEVLDCRNGYARVGARAAAANLDVEQVFLRDVDGEWEYIESGTGIDCGDPTGLSRAVLDACAALSRAG